MIILAALALTAQEVPAMPDACNKPVVMVITGTTFDSARMRAYGKAIADSKLYEELGGYYLNIPVAIADFEGEAETGHTTLIVRFPCLQNARTFWYSRKYQNDIRPLRHDPSAGDYIVRVYPEAPLRQDLDGKVGYAAYTTEFDSSGIEQAEP